MGHPQQSPHPSQKKSFAEVFTQAEGRGGIGVWSPTGLGYTYWHEKLIEALYGQFFAQGQTGLGPATTAAKIEAYAQLGWREPVEISTLFGDPALELHVAQPKIVMAVQSLTKEAVPGQPYAYEIVIANYGNATATNLTVLTQVDSNLTFKSASPMPDQGQNLWTIEELAAGTAQAIGITVEVAQPLTDGTAIDFAAILSRQTQLITVQRADTQVRNITIAPAPTPVPTSTPSNPDEPIILPPLLQDPSIEEPIGENLSPHLYMPLLLR